MGAAVPASQDRPEPARSRPNPLAPHPEPVPRWRRLAPSPYAPSGLAGAVLFVYWSLTPSLLPRDPAFQGLVTGISAAVGYGAGLLARRLARRMVRWRPGPITRHVTLVTLAVGGAGVVAISLAAGARWQREIHRLVGEQEPGLLAPVLVLVVALAVAVALLAAARLLRRLVRLVAAPLARRIPAKLATAVAVVVVALTTAGLFNEVVVQTALTAVDRAFSAANGRTTPGVEPPTSALRSGSPSSLSPWATLGVKGRDFVAGGPSTAELTRFAGRQAEEPIRIYVGLQAAADARDRAATAVAELERTGAFDREVLCLVTTTGTGWVDPPAAAALEYLHAGDTAIVATQYSYLPSWVSFLVDGPRAQESGTALFEAVHARWSQLPPNARPRLLLYGESLGSNGSQAAFDGLGEVRTRTDGALWVGPPYSNTLWRELVDRRDRGSPEWLPVYDEGMTVRFAADVDDLDQPDAPWVSPRVLFLQRASDPVVWWSPDLLVRRPDWLVGPRGADVSPSMAWYPVVTFWQVSADLAVATVVPPGHGHRYGDLIADGWAAVAPPVDWSPRDTVGLRTVVNAELAAAES